MKTVKFDFGKTIGKIKPMNSVGQPPLDGVSTEFFKYLKDANMTYSRLHDVGGWFGGNMFVDVPNIFRDFNADVNDPSSYDFTFTDILIKGITDADCEPIFRLGVTIENFAAIKSYRLDPPADYDKWARICEHIIRHYREGWADGFYYDITYWEIWNEPDNEPEPDVNPMWTGSAEDYYRLYTTASKHLKGCFGDSIKIGGYASCGFYKLFHNPEEYGFDAKLKIEPSRPKQDIYSMEFFHGFMKYIKKENAPIDFFSWHCYGAAYIMEIMADYLDSQLTYYGYDGIETMLNEWNPVFDYNKVGTSEACAKTAAVLCTMQNKKTDILCYYDARIKGGLYGGLFNSYTQKPFCTYYPFLVFGEMLKIGNQTVCDYEHEDGFYALAAAGDGENIAMLVNSSEKDMQINTNIAGASVYLIDEDNFYKISDLKSDEFVLKAYQVAVIK